MPDSDNKHFALWVAIAILSIFVALLSLGVLPRCSQQCGGYSAVAPSSNVELRVMMLEQWASEAGSTTGQVTAWQQDVTEDLNDLCDLHDECPDPETKQPPPPNPPPFP